MMLNISIENFASNIKKYIDKSLNLVSSLTKNDKYYVLENKYFIMKIEKNENFDSMIKFKICISFNALITPYESSKNLLSIIEHYRNYVVFHVDESFFVENEKIYIGDEASEKALLFIYKSMNNLLSLDISKTKIAQS